MHIGFDNSMRFFRNTFYFRYKDVRFKLIQNDQRKWCDVLLTIVKSMDDWQEQDRVFSIASEFLCALSWQNESRVTICDLGGPSVPENFRLRSAKCRFFSFPKIPFGGYITGFDLTKIPHIETENQLEALHLYRDGMSSNHDYLSFLFFWQILEIGCANPMGWIDKTLKRNRNRLGVSNEEIGRLPLNGRSLGNYLKDDCRNAIAHIRRKPGKTKLRLDTPSDLIRIARSTGIMKEFARFYIKNNLKLVKFLHLVRRKGREFPTYADEEFLRNNFCKLAYSK